MSASLQSFRAATARLRPRDMQRERLYAAELAAFDPTPADEANGVVCRASRRLPTLDEVIDYTARVTASAWFVKHYPAAAHNGIRVRDGRGRAKGSRRGGITMPRRHRKVYIVLHEIAHTLQPDGSAWHGREFCAIYLQLVRRFLGVDAHDRLRAEMRQRRIRYTPKRRATGRGNIAALQRWRAQEASDD